MSDRCKIKHNFNLLFSKLCFKMPKSVNKSDPEFLNESGFESYLSSSYNTNNPDTEWREIYKTLPEKLAHVYKTDALPKDITFLIGKDNLERISAHKFILCLSSRVFNDLLSTSCTEIQLDVENIAFKSLLQFIYTDEINLEGQSATSVLSLLKLASKYEIIHLVSCCCENLKENLSIDNCISILEGVSTLPSDHENHCVFDYVLQYILRNGIDVIESSSFLEISYGNACSIVQESQLAAPEPLIFQAVYRWAENKCTKDYLPLSPECIRRKMGLLLKLIRYPLMNPDEFTLLVVSKGILHAEEKAEVLQYISISKSLKSSFFPTLFSCKPRTGLAVKIARGLDFDGYPGTSDVNIRDYSEIILQQSLIARPDRMILRNCNLDLNVFVKDLSTFKPKARRAIETLSLDNVTLNNFDDLVSQCIRVPNLKHFVLKIITSMTDKNDELRVRNRVNNELGRFLFFTKKAKHFPWPWSLTYLWSLNVNILLSVNGIVVLNVDHEKNNLVLNEVNPVCLIIKSITAYEDIRNLAISFEESKNSQLIDAIPSIESVQILTLHNAYRINRLINYIQGFSNLSELVLYQCRYQEINLHDAIITPRMNLRKLAVGQAILKLSDNLSSNFLGMEKLTLWNCLWDDQFEKELTATFPNLREISIYNSFFDKPLYTTLDTLLLELKIVDKIIVSGYIWGSNSLHFSQEDSSQKCKLQEFFSNIGIRKNQYQFCLTRNHTRSCSTGSVWRSHEPSHQEIQKEMFQNFHFNQFYLDLETFLLKHDL